MELTREQVKNITERLIPGGQAYLEIEQVLSIAKQLLAELDKPKVWDGAPEWATDAHVTFPRKTGFGGEGKIYHRHLPKYREREIAEKIADKRWITETLAMNKKDFADAIESAINEYKEMEK